jgi:dethiobiotin synthase
VKDRLLPGVFVTGTDTGIGKTVVSALLMHRFRQLARVRYWKPVQTGIEQDDDSAAVRRLAGLGSDAVLDRGVRLRRPVSPHLAARLSGVTIALDDLVSAVASESASDRWVVEGAGGVLVPLNDRELIVDLMSRLGMPAVVVARSGLGTINHTLLTVEALRRRSIVVAGVVMVGDRNRENRDAIEKYSGVPVLTELPMLSPLTPRTLQTAADAAEGLDALAGLLGSTAPVAAARGIVPSL